MAGGAVREGFLEAATQIVRSKQQGHRRQASGRKVMQAEGCKGRGPMMGGSWGPEAWARLCGWGEGPRGPGRATGRQGRRAWRPGEGVGFCPKTMRSYWRT